MIYKFLISIFVFLAGLCIGSFLNCVIYRLENKKSLKGRSFCPHCKHTLDWKDLFPVFSFVALLGKCRYCHKKISWQYPIVEISTGLIFLLISNLQFSISNQFTIIEFSNLLYLLYIASVLIIIFIYDLKHYLIPDKILFPAIIISLFYQFFFSEHFLNHFFAGLVASGFFFVIFFISGGKWMGFGDVKLAILMGLFLGLRPVLTALFIAFFIGAIISVVLMVLHKKGLKSEVPFGPFLIAGTFIALFFAPQIVEWYLNLIV